MNEAELKSRFWRAFRSGSIRNDTNHVLPAPGPDIELHVIEEACFRAFDLVIAALVRSPCAQAVDYGGLITRTALFHTTALSKKCKIDQVKFFPVELKSDDDVLDGRLARQIATALITFGSSFVVLDKEHSNRMHKSRLGNILPATIIGFSETNDFEILSNPEVTLSSGIFRFDKRAIHRTLGGKTGEFSSDKLTRRLNLLQLILQKLAYCQFYESEGALDQRELDFLNKMVMCETFAVGRNIKELKKSSSNTRLTDFI